MAVLKRSSVIVDPTSVALTVITYKFASAMFVDLVNKILATVEEGKVIKSSVALVGV